MNLEDQDSTFFDKLNEKLAASVRGIYAGISHDEIISENLALSSANPDWSQRQKAKSVVSTCVKVCGGVGFTAASASMLPGIGIGVAYGSIIPEELYVLRCLFVMVLRIGNIYGHAPSSVGFEGVLALVGRNELASPNLKKTLFRKTATKAGDRLVSKMVTERLILGVEENLIRRSVFSTTLFRGFIKRLPILGVAVGSGMNMYSAQSVGRRSITYFSRETR